MRYSPFLPYPHSLLRRIRLIQGTLVLKINGRLGLTRIFKPVYFASDVRDPRGRTHPNVINFLPAGL